MKYILLSLFIILNAQMTQLFAQTDSDEDTSKSCPCCTAQYDQFDFWVGEWNVYDTTGRLVGENTISKHEDNCLVMERWQSSYGFTGRSMNYYRTADSTWNQVWVDHTGGLLDLVGRLEGGQMSLKDRTSAADGAYNLITWTPMPDSSVMQLWEVKDKEHVVQSILFKGIYRRK